MYVYASAISHDAAATRKREKGRCVCCCCVVETTEKKEEKKKKEKKKKERRAVTDISWYLSPNSSKRSLKTQKDENLNFEGVTSPYGVSVSVLHRV